MRTIHKRRGRAWHVAWHQERWHVTALGLYKTRAAQVDHWGRPSLTVGSHLQHMMGRPIAGRGGKRPPSDALSHSLAPVARPSASELGSQRTTQTTTNGGLPPQAAHPHPPRLHGPAYPRRPPLPACPYQRRGMEWGRLPRPPTLPLTHLPSHPHSHGLRRQPRCFPPPPPGPCFSPFHSLHQPRAAMFPPHTPHPPHPPAASPTSRSGSSAWVRATPPPPHPPHHPPSRRRSRCPLRVTAPVDPRLARAMCASRQRHPPTPPT